MVVLDHVNAPPESVPQLCAHQSAGQPLYKEDMNRRKDSLDCAGCDESSQVGIPRSLGRSRAATVTVLRNPMHRNGSDIAFGGGLL
jgi:hypothetical protein